MRHRPGRLLLAHHVEDGTQVIAIEFRGIKQALPGQCTVRACSPSAVAIRGNTYEAGIEACVFPQIGVGEGSIPRPVVAVDRPESRSDPRVLSDRGLGI